MQSLQHLPSYQCINQYLCLLVAGSLMQALYFTPNGAYVDKAIGALPGLPVPVNYPQYNSMAMLPLEGPNYSTQV